MPDSRVLLHRSGRPRLLDLFCGAGGCSEGYRRAGFEVVGVDIKPQPEYPFEFRELDALEMLRALLRDGNLPWDHFDAIHASPPCHAYSNVTGRNRHNRRKYVDLVEPTRDLLRATGLPYVIENVVGAPLVNAVMLCGSSFGLNVRRHRLFESNVPIMVSSCQHHWQTPRFRSLDSRQESMASVIGVHGHLNYPGELELRREAMGIDWMSNATLTQAIPPAYTEYLGGFLMAELTAREAA